MKNILKLSIVSTLLFAFCSHASVEEERFILDSADVQRLKETPGLISFKTLSDGAKSVIVVSKDMESTAKSFWASRNMAFHQDRIIRSSSTLSAASSFGVYNIEQLSFNDPRFKDQDSLRNEFTRYAESLMALRSPTKTPSIAILDAGVDPHEDHRVKRGYNFSTLYSQTESDSYRPENSVGEFTCKSSHGNAMKGIIGALQNNNIGIVGLSDADVYVGRVMSTDCVAGEDVGLVSDLYNGLNWAMGEHRVQKIPAVDVINISLAADMDCPVVIQEAINKATSKGIAVIVSAGNFGNQDGLSSSKMPANCEGVIVVGAHDETLNYANYSSRGKEVAFSMHGSYLTTDVPLFSNQSIYQAVSGTSASAAAASAFAANIKSNFPHVTSQQLKKVFQLSTIGPQQGCATLDCGSGAVDARKLVDVAEHLLDPKLQFNHISSDKSCEATKASLASSSYTNYCGAFMLSVNSSYAELGNTYEVRVFRKDNDGMPWSDANKSLLNVHLVTENKEVFGITDVDVIRFNYAASACYNGECPFMVDLKPSSLNIPTECQ